MSDFHDQLSLSEIKPLFIITWENRGCIMAPIIAPNIIRLTIELMGRAFVIKYKREVIKITIAPETAPQKIWVTRPFRNKSFRNFNISNVIIGNDKRAGPYEPGSKPS